MRNNIGQKGLTLVEMMVALVILLFVSLALMQVALVSIDSNLTNVLRDEAVSIAEQRMIDIKSSPYASLTPDGMTSERTDDPAPGDNLYLRRNFRVFSIDYELDWTITTSPDSNVKQIDVDVRWDWKGQNYSHSISSIVRGA